MSAASAKRPASSRKARTGHPLAKRPAAKSADRAAPRRALSTAAPPATTEAFDGPGYQFVGFRMKCRHRHVRH